MKPYKIGLVGARRGGGLLGTMAAHPRCEIAALCDIDPAALARLGEHFKLSDRQLHTDYDRFLAADLARRVTFLGQCKLVLIGLATLVVVWRMPRFIRDLDRELSGEKL